MVEMSFSMTLHNTDDSCLLIHSVVHVPYHYPTLAGKRSSHHDNDSCAWLTLFAEGQPETLTVA